MATKGIEQLRKSDMREAVKLFQKGLSMEIPPGKMKASVVRKELESTICYVHKTGKRLDGLVNFKLSRSRDIKLMFICVASPRKGIGSNLIKEVVAFGSNSKARWLYSYASLNDERAVKFYKSLGFRPYKKTGHFGSHIRLKIA